MLLLFVAALIAVGGIGFALGHVTAPSAAAGGGGANATGRGGFGRAFPSFAPGSSFAPGDLGGGGRTIAGGLSGGVSGTVQSITPTSMTVQMSNGTVVTNTVTPCPVRYTFPRSSSVIPSEPIAQNSRRLESFPSG